MIFIVLNWAYIGLTSFLMGFFIGQVIEKFLGIKPNTNFTLLSLLGLAVLAIVLGLSSLFIKISLLANTMVIGMSILPLLFFRSELKAQLHLYWSTVKGSHILFKLVFFISFLIALEKSFMETSHYDAGLYYLQTMKWMQSYPVVPGLANLHTRLGFNSNWHLLSALYAYDFGSGIHFNELNSYLYLLILLFALQCILRLQQGKGRVVGFFMCFLIFAMALPDRDFITHRSYILLNSTTADFPAAMLLVVIFMLFLQRTEEKRQAFNTLLVFAFSSLVITIKLSTAPIILLPLSLLFIQKKIFQRPYLWLSVILSLGIAIPWLVRNTILSGYLVFPFYQLDLFSFDWEVPKDIAKNTGDLVTEWAIGNVGVVFESSWDRTLAWYHRWKLANLALIWGTLINLLVLLPLGVYTLIRKKTDVINLNLILVYVTGFAGLLFWAIKAPDMRFGYGFTVSFNLIALSVLVHYFLKDKSLHYHSLIFLILLSIFSFTFNYGTLKQVGRKFFVAPPAVRKVSMRTHRTSSGKVIYKPKKGKDQCFGHDLPCSPESEIEHVEFRGELLSDGFISLIK